MQILKELEKLTHGLNYANFIADRCEVYNNIACACRKINKLHTAKKYLEKALELTKNDFEDNINKSTTFLNMCAVLSNLNRHAQATRYAKQAIQYAQEELVNAKLDENQESMSHKVAVLGIAYNNMGVEEEFLGNKKEALNWYRKAFNFMMKNATAEQQHLVQNFRMCYEEASKQIEKLTIPKFKRPYSAILPKNNHQASVSSQSTHKSKINSKLKNRIQIASESKTASPFYKNGFDARYQIETKPYTFEDKRVKSKRKIHSNKKTNRLTKFEQHNLDSNCSDTDTDIKDLEELGLLSDLEENFISKNSQPKRLI